MLLLGAAIVASVCERYRVSFPRWRSSSSSSSRGRCEPVTGSLCARCRCLRYWSSVLDDSSSGPFTGRMRGLASWMLLAGQLPGRDCCTSNELPHFQTWRNVKDASFCACCRSSDSKYSILALEQFDLDRWDEKTMHLLVLDLVKTLLDCFS